MFNMEEKATHGYPCIVTAEPHLGQEVTIKATASTENMETGSKHTMESVDDDVSVYSSFVQQQENLVLATESLPDHHCAGASPRSDSWGIAFITWAKNVLSGALLVFCFTLLTVAIFTRQTRATSDVGVSLHPIVAFVLFLAALFWLAIIEGSLNCLVGLRPVQEELYQHTHPLALRATRLCPGQNLERFIVGRQYMDLTMVFTISFLATAVKDISVLGLPHAVCVFFLNSGFAVTLVTIVLGQLVLQINAPHFMLDYMNNYFMLASTYMSLAMEATGVCHVVYLVQRIVSNIHHYHEKKKHGAKAKDSAKAKPSTTRSTVQRVFFWVRILFSSGLLTFALVTVAAATLKGQTEIWEGVPPWASFVLFFALVFLVGMMDALQISLVAVVHMPREMLLRKPTAAANADYVIQRQQLPSFLVGRQIGQTAIQFLLTRLLSLDITPGQGDNVWGVNNFWQKVFNSGGLGAIITTVLASLCWRVLASEFPLMFLSSPFSRPIIQLCLVAERTGIINISWALAAVQRRVLGMKTDETYLGANALRPASNRKDNDTNKGKGRDDTDDDDDCNSASEATTHTGDMTEELGLAIEIDSETQSTSLYF